MSEHTPTPWVARRSQLNDLWSIYVGTNGDKSVAAVHDPYSIDDAVAEANAALIVRAVNSHDALIQVLKEANLQIEYLHEKFQPTGSGTNVLARIAAALKDADSA